MSVENMKVGFAGYVTELNNVDLKVHRKYANAIQDVKIKKLFLERIDVLSRELENLKRSAGGKDVFLEKMKKITAKAIAELPEGINLSEDDWYILDERLLPDLKWELLRASDQAGMILTLKETEGAEVMLPRIYQDLSRSNMKSQFGRELIQEIIPITREVVEEFSGRCFNEVSKTFCHYQTVCMKLFDYYTHLGRFEDAFQVGKLLVEKEKTALGQYHQNVGASFSNIGAVLEGGEKHDESLKYYIKGLNVWKKSGKRKLEAESYHNIAGILSKMGREDQAAKYLNKAEDLRKTIEENASAKEPVKSYVFPPENFDEEFQKYMDWGMQFAEAMGNMSFNKKT